MKVSYTGIHQALSDKLQDKLDAKFHKLAKLLDHPGGERAAHVVVTGERHLCKSEITIKMHGHSLVSLASDADLFTAIWKAIEKLEKQSVKVLARGREKARRHSRATPPPEEPISLPAKKVRVKESRAKSEAAQNSARPRIFRTRDHQKAKPMTLDEAVLQMEDGRGYLVYRDTERELVTLLVRRPDGHFDLVET